MNNVDVMSYVIEKGSTINAQDVSVMPLCARAAFACARAAFACACARAAPRVGRDARDVRARVNAWGVQYEGLTALHWAVLCGSFEAAQHLVNTAGASKITATLVRAPSCTPPPPAHTHRFPPRPSEFVCACVSVRARVRVHPRMSSRASRRAGLVCRTARFPRTSSSGCARRIRGHSECYSRALAAAAPAPSRAGASTQACTHARCRVRSSDRGRSRSSRAK